jgi:hypothetical protein
MRNRRDPTLVDAPAEPAAPSAAEGGFGRDPFAADDDMMKRLFYGTGNAPRVARPVEAPRKDLRPTHYKVVSISLYTEDIDRIDRLVQQLKDMGHTKANRSSLIRFAIDQVDISRMPKGY